MFFGRHDELSHLKDLYASSQSQLAVIYGRRRIGKSTLIKHFGQKKRLLSFEGIEGARTPLQITHFANTLKKYFPNNKLLQHAQFKSWQSIFDFLTELEKPSSKDRKLILFLDEFQWMAGGQSQLVSLIKFYWDNFWKNQNLLLILCGSIASFMVRKVIKSKALYGRISLSLKIGKLLPNEAKEMLSKRGQSEVLKYLLVLGGVPKYLEMIDQTKSFEQNMRRLFFGKHALLADEFHTIFYSHFKEPQLYLRIVEILLEEPKSLSEIALKLNLTSGGGLQSYLDNLELADFIRSQTPYLSKAKSKLKKYSIKDEYLRFFGKYLLANEMLIKEGGGVSLFNGRILRTWEPWLGIAFESFCQNNALLLAKKMHFEEEVQRFGPLFHRGDSNFQIDLVYERSDKVVTLCEIKYHQKEISTSVISEVRRKASLIKLPRGHTLELALIAPSGADKALREAEFFHHIITEKELF